MKKLYPEFFGALVNRLNGAEVFYTSAKLRILLALAFSLLIHLFFLANHDAFSPRPLVEKTGSLYVSLVRAEATSPASKMPSEHLLTTPPPPPLSLSSDEVKKNVFTEPVRRKSSKPELTSLPGNKASEASEAAVGSAPKAELPPGLLQSGPKGPAKQVDIEFEIISGKNRDVIGKGSQHYVSPDGDYFGLTVRQMSESGQSDEIAGWELNISGRINRNGLSPQVFEMKGALPERLIALRAIPDSALPPNSEKPRSGRMPDGILDRQTLLYQFMHKPPEAGGGKLWLTDGAIHGVYNYRVAGSEVLRIPSLGEIRTVKLVVTALETSEVLELWLVPNLSYLPAKVRHIDERGVETEQLVVGLRFE